MSLADGRHWFIDAWAVLDGYAFASFRSADSLDADVTLFVAPPYFEPEPVASLATALGATRGHFQEGFHGPNGAEVPFATLPELIETIRRGYRAGGLDIDGTPVPAVRVPPVEPPAAGAAVNPAELVTPDMDKMWSSIMPLLRDDSPTVDRLKQLEPLLVEALEAAFPALIAKFVGYALVTMLHDITDPGPERSKRTREVCAWIDLARRLGITIDIQADRLDVALEGTPGFEWLVPWVDRFPRALRESLHPLLYRMNGALVNDLHVPFSVAIPPAFQAAKYPPIPTLGHLLAVATADRRYMHALRAMHEFVPLLVLALTQLPSGALPYPGLPPRPGTPESRDLCARASAWLARALPSGVLRENTAVEDALHDLVTTLLTRSSEEDKGRPAPLPPAPPSGPPPKSPGPHQDVEEVPPRAERLVRRVQIMRQ